MGNEDDPPLCATVPIADRLEECFQALKNALQVVAIDLDQGDDAQVIFETLNARGEPLLPADLLRNFIFLRAARAEEDQEWLYETYWSGFDDDFWRQETRQGRLTRPRSDLFMQHFLASRQGYDIPIKHLFVEYKYWLSKKNPFDSVEDELKTLAEQRQHFRRLIQATKQDPLYRVASFLRTFDVSTAYPLFLWFLSTPRQEEELVSLGNVVESYLVRRAVCGLTVKNYNRMFLRIVTAMQKQEMIGAADIASYLTGQKGEASMWPTDGDFAEAWRSNHVYHTMNNPKVVYILSRISETYYTDKMERIELDDQLTVEHLMPQSWQPNWPLLDGSTGLTQNQIWMAEEGDPATVPSQARMAAVQTFGNLTVLTQHLNSSVSNAAWSVKKPGLLSKSLLPINQHLHMFEKWDETEIAVRSQDMLSRALKLWRR